LILNSTADENLQRAMDLAASQEQTDEAERKRLLEASKKKGEIRYDKDNIPESAEELYNDTREDKPDLPQWYKLDSDEKDVYFSYIKRNSLEEHAAAADALNRVPQRKGITRRWLRSRNPFSRCTTHYKQLRRKP